MKKIISVSRRTDIPAFYGDWFMNRLGDGFAGYVNPFGGQKNIVSLESRDVACFVFWSKNYAPFMDKIGIIEDTGYNFYFNYTITGLPGIFESNNVDKNSAIENLKELSNLYSPVHINWRYDPIIISDITDHEFHISNFKEMASELEGYVERCYFSFVHMYGKVKKNFFSFQKDKGLKITDPDTSIKIDLVEELSGIAEDHGIKMYSCCKDHLVGEKIMKAHCIDGNIIERLFYENGFDHHEKPTRKECGCTYSVDIGGYDTCPHGCIYCYANLNKRIANTRYQDHDMNSGFLGYTSAGSVKWIEEAKRKLEKGGGYNRTLFDEY